MCDKLIVSSNYNVMKGVVKLKKWIVVFALLIVLSGCSNSEISKETRLIEDLGFEGLSTEGIITKLGEMSPTTIDISASIYDDVLIVRSDSVELKYEMPEDKFYVAVAPYENTTHTWRIHSATGCRGELVEKIFDVIVKDNYGKEVLNKEVTSLKNGFFEIWLPRELEGTISVNYNGLSSITTISTFDGDLTCLTTMELR